ncbi:MAG: acyl carrier protein [Kiritimatiellae bacterium]|nr:acyl carrier protein [Kiritimatiellia bacterium]
METNRQKLSRVFREVFGIEDLSDDLTRNDVPEWNSLQTVNLILTLEETFGVSLTPEDAQCMVSVRLIKDVLADKGIGFPSRVCDRS